MDELREIRKVGFVEPDGDTAIVYSPNGVVLGRAKTYNEAATLVMDY